MEPGMLNENQNKPGWKSRLEDTVDLRGETCNDKNELWDKLDSRLHGKPRRKRFVWYWAAAACLLLAMIFPFIKSNHVATDNVKTTTKKIQSKTTDLLHTAPVITNENVEKTTVMVEEKRSEKKSVQPVHKQNVSNNNVKEEQPLNKVANLRDEAQTALIVAPVVATTATPTLVATTMPVVKQKLKVVHINEVGDIVEDSHANEHITEHHTIRIEFMSQDIYTSTAPSHTVYGLAIFKTKTSPSN